MTLKITVIFRAKMGNPKLLHTQIGFLPLVVGTTPKIEIHVQEPHSLWLFPYDVGNIDGATNRSLHRQQGAF